MKETRFATSMSALVLASTIWSCTNRDAPADAIGTAHAQEEQAPPQAPAPGSGPTQRMRAQCPMIVQGANVAVSDTEGGVALTFTTDEGDVSELRARVQHMAQMYEMHRGRGHVMWHRMGAGRGRMGQGPGAGMGPMGRGGSMPSASSTVTEIERGSRLELKPTDPAQLEALRQHVRWHQQRMQSGECWMLQNQPAQSPQPSPREQR